MQKINVKSILSAQNGMNVFRGCTHGCIYCDARSTCYQIHPDRPFEDIEVKINAPELLEKALKSKRHRCMIGTGAMCDPYMPIEKELKITRKCIELIDEYEYGLAIQTKSDLILRDLDLLKSINKKTKCVVQMTLTTYDENLCRLVEPNVCTTKRRAEVLNILRDEGIKTVCWMTPVLPYINDTEENLRGILKYCIDAKCYGILSFNLGLTLREGDREYYYSQLDRIMPGMKEKYIRNYGNSYSLGLPDGKRLMQIFRNECNNHNIVCNDDKIFQYMHEFEEKNKPVQLSFFNNIN